MALLLKRRKKLFPVLKQRDMSECGTTCLAMIFQYYGMDNARELLREMAGVTSEGTSLYQLKMTAARFNFNARGYQGSYSSLEEITSPCIAHYEGNHFVIIRRADYRSVWITDPGYGRVKMDKNEFLKKWNGIYMTVEPEGEGCLRIHDSLMDKLANLKNRKKEVIRKFYLQPVVKHKKSLKKILLISLLLQLCNLVLPFTSSRIFDSLSMERDPNLLQTILLIFLGVFITQTFLTYIRNISLARTKVAMEEDFIACWFDHLIHLCQKYFDTYKREDFINRFNQNLQIRKMFTAAVIQRLLDVLFIIVYVTALFFISPILGFYALIFTGIFALITVSATPFLSNLEDIIFHESLKPMGTFLDALLGMQTVKLFNLERRMFRKWQKKYKDSLKRVKEAEVFAIKIETLITIVYQLSYLGVFWLGAWLVMEGRLSIGQFIAFTTLFSLISTPILSFIGLWQMFTSLNVIFNKLNDVFIQEREDLIWKENRSAPLNWDLEVNDLTFSYTENSDTPVLQGMEFTVPQGSMTAIVGRNGSGKTTLVKLLTKIYSHYRGSIRLGGHEIREIHHETLRDKIAMVPQDIYIFDGTIRENLLYANPNATPHDLEEAVRLACFDEFIRKNYLGYEYRVGESGSCLSGGQRLRLAFARLFLSDPEIILLDEATSVLDVESEKIIMENLKIRFPGKTVISIAHRLSTIKNADVVLVLEEGRVAEKGQHEELLQLEGIYYRFMKTYLDF